MQRHHPDSPLHHAGGFTLIELMVVIAILGLLAAALLPNLLAASETQNVADTQARMAQLRVAVEAFERQYDFYPPDDFQTPDEKLLPMPGTVDRVNAGIESLMVALHQKKVRGLGSFADQANWLGNTDDDDYGVEIPLLGSSKKQEVVDAWGNPIVYFYGDLSDKRRARVQLGDQFGGEVVDVKPAQDPTSGKPLGFVKGYQLISAGSNGVFGDDDDITVPERRIE